ncbi:MAG: hypothetical protein IJS90_04685, partial [Clostridia bacterium]|nr:hypothetical protein [Clostridia bacterium]
WLVFWRTPPGYTPLPRRIPASTHADGKGLPCYRFHIRRFVLKTNFAVPCQPNYKTHLKYLIYCIKIFFKGADIFVESFFRAFFKNEKH